MKVAREGVGGQHFHLTTVFITGEIKPVIWVLPITLDEL